MFNKLPQMKFSNKDNKDFINKLVVQQPTEVKNILSGNCYITAKILDTPKAKRILKVKIIRVIGNIGEIDVEAEALLQEHQVYTEDFGP